MKNLYTFIILFCYLINANAQNDKVKILQPEIWGEDIDFDKMGKIEERASYLEQKVYETKNATPAEEKELSNLYDKYGEDGVHVWDIIWGCSWYCGGGPKQVTASSSLAPVPKKNSLSKKENSRYTLENQENESNEYTYYAENAHDLYLKTAWVEGVKGHGIGEYLEYTFDNQSPRVTMVSIYNGYVKSKKTWKDNSRVRSLKMYVNGKPYAILQLKDTWACQNFDLGEPLGRTPDEKDMVLRFEITDVYPGDKYEDTAITELFFDGTDVHCVAKGTQIMMNDNSLENIENVKSGDIIKSYDVNKSTFTEAKVKKVITVKHDNLLKLSFNDGSEILITEEHPLLTKEKSWSSFNPQKSRIHQLFVNQYKVGDVFILYTDLNKTKHAKLTEIEKIDSPNTETYTLELETGNNFIGNNLIIREE